MLNLRLKFITRLELKMSDENSANKGAIVKVSETSHSAQDVFIGIKKRFFSTSDKGYSLNIGIHFKSKGNLHYFKSKSNTTSRLVLIPRLI